VALAEQLRGPFDSPGDLMMTRDTQAAAYAEVGRFDQAVVAEQQAIAEAVKINAPPKYHITLQAHLAAFQARQPWREGSKAP
jgi:hypothetical protein